MNLSMEDLVAQYIKIREKQAQLKVEYEAKNAPYEDVKSKIEALILQRFEEQGVNSMKTKAGTAYVSVTARASLGDWDTYKAFLDRQDNPYDFLERRVSTAAVENYKTEPKDLPPGINWVEVRGVNFRKT